MVKAPLVVPDEQFGTEVLRTLDQAGFATNVAFWAKTDNRWELVLSTPSYDKLGPLVPFQLISPNATPVSWKQDGGV
jgi:hypothetical protein